MAIEIAQQRRAAGEQTALLAVIEARSTNAATREKLGHMVRGFDPQLMAFWFTVITGRCYGIEVGSGSRATLERLESISASRP